MIKRYKEHISKYLKEREIRRFLEDNRVLRYTINEDLTVDVNGDVDISNNPNGYYSRHNKQITRIPCKFKKITGYFDCSYNQLTSFDNFPDIVYQELHATNNNFTSTMGFNTKVTGYIDLSHNLIESFTPIQNREIDTIDISSNPIKYISSDVVNNSNSEDIRCFENSPIYELLNYFRQKQLGRYLMASEDVDDNIWRGPEKVMTLILERLNEFEVIKECKIDLHSLNSLYDFCEANFDEDKRNLLYKLERLDYKIYGE